MNIAQAKQIPIEAVLKALQAQETKARPDRSEIWYLSPLRQEETASFKIDAGKNVWYDHGTGQGGDVIKLVQEHLGGATVSEALKWLKGLEGYKPTAQAERRTTAQPGANARPSSGASVFELVKEKELSSKPLLAYALERGIPRSLLSHFCSEVYFRSGKSGKQMFGIGFQNNQGGFEVRGAMEDFKAVVGPKAITTLAGPGIITQAHLFEGFMDFLSFVRMVKPEPGRAGIILNGAGMISEALAELEQNPRLQSVEDVYLWFDNDDRGEEITHQAAAALESRFRVGDMRQNYHEAEDLNARLQLGLQAGRWPAWAERKPVEPTNWPRAKNSKSYSRSI